MTPAWLEVLAIIYLAIGFGSAFAVIYDIWIKQNKQKMRIMNIVWPDIRSSLLVKQNRSKERKICQNSVRHPTIQLPFLSSLDVTDRSKEILPFL